MRKKTILIILLGVFVILSIIFASALIVADKKASSSNDAKQTQLEIITEETTEATEITTEATTEATTTETTTSAEYADFDWDDMPETNPNAANSYEFNVTMEKENTIQVLGIGNSDLYSGYNPNIAWKNYGFTNTIVAYANLTAPQAYAHLRQALDVQSPKVVFIEVAMMYEGIRFIGSATVDSSRKTTELPEPDTELSLLEQRTITHGYKFSSKSVKLVNNPYAFKTSDVDMPPSENVDYLNKMITLCKIKNAKPVLVYLPTIVYWNYARHNAFDQIAKENDIEFIDMNLLLDEAKFDITNDFRDAGNHLNFYGAKACTLYLSKHFVSEYDLKDCRHIAEYKYWNDNFKEYKKLVANV